MDLSYYNSYYEVNLPTIGENFRKIQAYIGKTQIMPVLKADAYGLGLVRIAQYLCQQCSVEVFACAQVCEGVTLRQNGITVPILILGPAPFHTLSYVVEYDLQIPVFSAEGLRQLDAEAKKQKKIARAQIKIETGMNRIGVKLGEPLDQLLAVLTECSNIEITGAYTHFVQADLGDDPFTRHQYMQYQAAVQQIEAQGISLTYRHTCNTPATEWFTEAVADSTHIRVGSLVLGYSDMEDGSNPIEVREALSWRSFITNIHTVYPGESVSYSRFFQPTVPTRVATVGVGFGDGLYNPLAKQSGPVLVNDTRTHYLDTCMDQCFVDVTGLDCKIGDEVTLFGYTKNGVLLSPKEFAPYGQIYTAHTSATSFRTQKIYLT